VEIAQTQRRIRTMPDRDDENMVDPPDTQGGGGKTETDEESGSALTADPPSTDGGTKG
jgi:hypothetical protein